MEFDNIDLPTHFNPKTCIRKGLCPVTQVKPHPGPKFLDSHSLYFEQHGKGTKHKILLIMGLNSSSFAWKGQVDWFGGGGAFGGTDDSTVLVFDNRGVGNSGYPTGPYSTSGMAQDIVTLLDYVGWTEEKDVHVVGISLGGMIAQELALRIPERIGTLILAVTTPGGYFWNNLPPWKGLTTLIRGLFTPDPADKVGLSLGVMFPDSWLDAESKEQPGRTNRSVQTEEFTRRLAITKRQRVLGVVSQMAAGLTHHVDLRKLERMDSFIDKIVIVTGDDDHLVAPCKSHALKAVMKNAELVEWKGTGHGIHIQHRQQFNMLIERSIAECL